MTDIEQELLRLRKSHARLRAGVACLALALGAALLVGATTTPKDASFGSIDAERINLREPDGTLRLTISNQARFPGAFFRNREVEHPRDVAGFLFFNDEGTEQGGLIYNGRTGKDGKPSSGVSLTFDRYQQDQQMQLLGVDEAGTHFAGLSFNDVADGVSRPIFSDADSKANEAGDHAITQRVFLGKSASRNSTLLLLDAKGNPRLELSVAPSGEARIAFLDEDGNEVKAISGKQ